MKEDYALELIQLSHVYVNDFGASIAVENIDFKVRRGEFVSLVGPSGCGKTTILNMMAGLIKPTSGTIQLNGARITDPTAKVGYMQQQDYLFPWRTIMQNITIGLEIRREKTKDHMKRAEMLLEELELSNTANKYPHELSGGMRQRVALARTLVTDPHIMLLDEPFSALDLQIKMQLEQLVRETMQRMKKTAILVTHDLGEAVAISDRVIVLGRNPGHIRTIIEIPLSLRKAGPIEARKLPEFNEVFDEVWNELNVQDESEGKSHVSSN